MKSIYRAFIIIAVNTLFISFNGQEKLTVRYIGNKSSSTLNNSFVNNTFIFLERADTIFMNVKVPYDAQKREITNRGLYYNCMLKQDSTYTISLKRITADSLPKEMHSYYKLNAIFSLDGHSFQYKEVNKDTKYLYQGYYERYVDIENSLFEIVGLSPDGNCFYPH